ncbi:MAG: MiaB/RimO family radical SAM methylthiotransferase [Coriobacteriia bacterium]|nr:MiaB/RimO family radical SAM methylthiotransferase [Coriobacteriia bacterium]
MTERFGRGVAIRTLGCKVNRAESEAIAAALLGDGAPLSEESDAAVVVVNTCTVTGEADAKARKAVRHALAGASQPTVVVTGCLAALDHDALAALGERVVVEADKSRVAALVEELLGAQASRGGDHPLVSRAEDPAFRTRVSLKVEDGCDAFCSYCIVPYARGVPRAVALDEVVTQALSLVATGTREIVLTGINIGRYEHAGHDLADVIDAVAATGIARVRLSSIEPLDLTPRLLAAMAAAPAFCAHLHVPLQAGSDSVLAAMGRAYTCEEFLERIRAAREALPGLVVTTDVLAGFPGETAEQAAETLALCERVGFGKLHVFRYSRRPGTPAAIRADQVDEPTKGARAAGLRQLSARLAAARATARVGAAAEVLVERVVRAGDAQPMAEGTTRDYLRVKFPALGAAPGELAQVRLVHVDGEHLLGERLL